MNRVLRWLAVPVVAFVFWATVRMLGLLGLQGLSFLCPAELVVDYKCTASWYPTAEILYVLLHNPTLSAGIVLVPATVAPSHRVGIALLGFGWSMAFTFMVYVLSGEMWIVGSIVTGASGVLALWFAVRLWRKRLAITPPGRLASGGE